MDSWKYNQKVMMPTCAPHEEADLSVFNDKKLWKKDKWKDALLAKYTSCYDCKEQTGWYYCIKDTPFDISKLKSKYRYEVKKGIENFEVKIINPADYVKDLYEVSVDSISQYDKAYRNVPTYENFVKYIPTWKKPTFIAIDNESGEVAGCLNMVEKGKVLLFNMLRVKRKFEGKFVNHALTYHMLEYYKQRLASGEGYYIVDGEKNINHATAFQDFLCKKFQFRKANCKLNLVYRPKIKFVIKMLYPFRKLLKKLDKIKIIHKINGVLVMEEIVRKQKV